MKIKVTRLDIAYLATIPERASAAFKWAVETESDSWLVGAKAYRYLDDTTPPDVYVELTSKEQDGLMLVDKYAGDFLTEGCGRMSLDNWKVRDYIKKCCIDSPSDEN